MNINDKSAKIQRGFTTLMIVLTLLIALTTVILSGTRSGMLEQSLSSNDIRSKEIQQAAEGALEYALAWMANNKLGWLGANDDVIDCEAAAACPILPAPLTGNDGGVITINYRFERNPRSPNFIQITVTAKQVNNNSQAICSIGVTSNGVPIPGTWRDF